LPLVLIGYIGYIDGRLPMRLDTYYWLRTSRHGQVAIVTPFFEEPSSIENGECYDCCVFNFGKPKTPGQWIGHVVAAIIALFLVWWMLRLYIV
jgi:hypothetical protein